VRAQTASRCETQMKRGTIIWIVVGLFALLMVFRTIGTYNELVALDQEVDGQWAQVQTAYQRRADLIPNLVETVKAAAAHERETLTAVTEARAKVGQLTVTSDMLNDPKALAQFQQAQDGLSSALTRLMAVSERYPDLRANENFLALQSQLEGTENRISVERMRFNDAAKAFNTRRQSFPTVLIANMMGDQFEKKVFFEATAGADQAPEVKF
jgi:LemA protein